MSDPTLETKAASSLKGYTIDACVSGILGALAATIPNDGVRVAAAAISPFVGSLAGIWIRHRVARYNYNQRGRWLREEVERLTGELHRADLTSDQYLALQEQLNKQNAKLLDLEPPTLSVV
jgi:hypothetical protein